MVNVMTFSTATGVQAVEKRVLFFVFKFAFVPVWLNL